MFVSMLRLHAGLTRSDILRTGSPRILSDELTRSGDSGPRQHSAPQNPRWAGLRNRTNLIFALVISFAVIVAVLIRWSGLGSQSLWLYEGITFWISRFSPKHIWHILWLDTSNPLYYVLLHYWSVCFGTSEFSLRALSALFGTLSIPLFYGVARKIMADRTSLALATMLYAVSFLQVWYAQEARCYSLLVFLSLGTVYWLILCLANRATFRLCGLVLFLVAGLYTHNITIFTFLGLLQCGWSTQEKRPFARVSGMGWLSSPRCCSCIYLGCRIYADICKEFIEAGSWPHRRQKTL